ncbi:thiamine-phosphate kinase [Derxia gummosa]|uniref:Thiamine-monophosphate kinase n=1 Tax=Derxia gummosa DSM 723 TaxID=1121388 RepID=A0A8B6X858_9BURK|nr:thiamine-phosphate kinase [Derxia gummosa]
MGEFELIERLFRIPAAALAERRPGVLLGIGDDCALLDAGPLAVSTDMLIEGRHFFPDVDPAALGHKSLAVNLSDLAAMGAEPLAFTLALALPAERARDLAWCEAFAGGMLALAAGHGCALVGGDTTAGPLTISITVFGRVAPALAPRRDGARIGDDLWITGTIGDAALALEQLFAARGQGGAGVTKADSSAGGTDTDAVGASPDAGPAAIPTRHRLERPTPRCALGRRLPGLATSAIDISDGLAGDLGHVLAASGVDAVIDLDRLPLSPVLLALAPDARWRHALAGGDDYELCFTAPVAARDAVLAAAAVAATPIARAGSITARAGDRPAICWRRGDAPVALALRGFDHFA